MKIMQMKTIRRGVVALAFAGAAVAGGSGIAEAQSDTDYPPVPTVPTTDAPVDPVVSPENPSEENDTDSGTTLPQTGGPGTSQILLIAGAAVAAGVAVTGVAGRRRNDNLNAA